MNFFGQKGIALIQVLLISAIISVLALYLSKTARLQVDIAKRLKDKNFALIKLYDTEAVLTHSLLTFNLKRDNSSDKVNNRWNFHNQVFNVSNNIDISIQDNAGLINLRYLNSSIFSKWMACNGYSSDKTRLILDSISDWQDKDDLTRLNGAESSYYTKYNYKPRNNAIILKGEVLKVKGVNKELYTKMDNITALYTPSFFNPMNSPDELLRCIYDNKIGEQLQSIRSSDGFIDINRFKELTGEMESEGLLFFTSSFLTIKISSVVGESKVEKLVSQKLDKYAKFNQPVVETFFTKWN